MSNDLTDTAREILMAPYESNPMDGLRYLLLKCQEGSTIEVTPNAAQAYVEAFDRLVAALRPFVVAYNAKADPIGDSDLYPEQPRSVHVTLGDCRRAAMLLMELDK